MNIKETYTPSRLHHGEVNAYSLVYGFSVFPVGKDHVNSRGKIIKLETLIILNMITEGQD